MPFERDDSPYGPGSWPGDFTQGVDMGFGPPGPGFPGGLWIATPPSAGPPPPSGAPATAQREGGDAPAPSNDVAVPGPSPSSNTVPGGWDTSGAYGVAEVTKRQVRQLERMGRAIVRGVAKGAWDIARDLYRTRGAGGAAPPAPPTTPGIPIPRDPSIPPMRTIPPVFGPGGMLGRSVIGYGIWAYWPWWPTKQLGSGELPYDIPPVYGPIQEANRVYRERVEAERARARQQQRIEQQDRRDFGTFPPGNQITLPPTPRNYPNVQADPYIPQDRSVPDIIRDAAREAVQDAVRNALPDAVRPFIPDVPDVPAGPGYGPGPAGGQKVAPPAASPGRVAGNTGVTSMQGTSSGTSSGGSRARRSRWLVTAGTIAGAALLEQAFVRERGGGMTNTPAPSSGTTTGPGTIPLTDINAGSIGSWGSNYCTPRPRGPRRKCLQRAPVRWSGGPRKGKAAGTRCIRYKA